VAQVVESDRPELRPLLRGAVAATEGGPVEVTAVDAGEDEVIRAGEPFTLQHTRER
jgi:hypothetical protein